MTIKKNVQTSALEQSDGDSPFLPGCQLTSSSMSRPGEAEEEALGAEYALTPWEEEMGRRKDSQGKSP